MNEFSRRSYFFDDFILDLDRGCLLRAGKEVKLRPKSFEVLKYLVEHHSRLVSKSDLMHAVWSDAFVTDDSLVQCLIEVRRALGDKSRRYVKTVPRRGYIFEAQVNENEAKTQNQVSVAVCREPSIDPGQRPGRRPGNRLMAIVMIWGQAPDWASTSIPGRSDCG
jgi:DNA-binding winged helix-turn-helix (wHTH) protein